MIDLIEVINMFEKFKNFIYDISDFLVTIIVVFIVVASITFVMNKSFGFDFAKYGIMNSLSEVETNVSDSDVKDNKVNNNKEKNETITPIKPKQNKTPTETPSQPETKTEIATQTPTETDKPENTVAEETKDVFIEVVEGEFPTDIAEKLEEAGVIKDRSTFVQAIIDGGYASLLQLGEYTFKTNMTDDEALGVLFP